MYFSPVVFNLAHYFYCVAIPLVANTYNGNGQGGFTGDFHICFSYARVTLNLTIEQYYWQLQPFYVQKVAVTIELLCPANDTIMFVLSLCSCTTKIPMLFICMSNKLLGLTDDRLRPQVLGDIVKLQPSGHCAARLLLSSVYVVLE